MPEERVFYGVIIAVGKCDEESIPLRKISTLHFFLNGRKGGGENLLRTICPFPAICHTHQPLGIDLPPPQVLVRKHFPTRKGACTTSAISIRDVAALNHEFGYNAVEGGVFVT